MLVLTRKVGESIVIEGGITIRVLDGGGQRIRLGIEAPASVRILRGELAESSQMAVQCDAIPTSELPKMTAEEFVPPMTTC